MSEHLRVKRELRLLKIAVAEMVMEHKGELAAMKDGPNLVRVKNIVAKWRDDEDLFVRYADPHDSSADAVMKVISDFTAELDRELNV